MDLHAHSFRCFIVVAEELSFTRAAERIGLTQSALSMRIRDMEQQLGLTLFHRSSRKVSLTAAGSELLDQARRILEEADRFQQLCVDLRTTPEAPLVIAMPVSAFGNDWWMAAIDRFQALEPAVAVRLSRHAMADVIASVVSGKADIGFTAGRPQAGLDAFVITRVPIDLAVPEEWPIAIAGSLSRADLVGMPILAFDHSMNPNLYSETLEPLAAAGMKLVPSPHGIIGSGFAAQERIATVVFAGRSIDRAESGMRRMQLADLKLEVTLCAIRAPGATRRPARRFWESLRGPALAV